MRRPLAASLAALLVLAAAGAAWAWRFQRGPASGQLVLMRDEGGCLVGENRGVALTWTEAGATLAPVTDRIFDAVPRTIGAAQPFPLERARALARRFTAATGGDDPPLRVFRARTMGVTLRVGDNVTTASLDCRADFGNALLIEAEGSGETWDWIRYGAHRAHLWTPRCEGVDPLLTELFETLPQS